MSLEQISHRSKKRLLQMHFESGVGHIGGNLSCLDILLVLHHRILGPQDQFILSKGHSAGALYVTLWSLGRILDDDLKTFHKDSTRLSAHPSPHWQENILFATGSLGHGFSLSNGLALAKKLKKEPGHIFCVMSDGEWQEGSNWEALIFARHQKLTNLTIIIDANGLQGFGTTKDVGGLDPLIEKLQAFGLPTQEVDGHDLAALEKALSEKVSGPRILIANTTKGKGVSFMENKMEWHYLPLTEELYRQALAEMDKLL